MNNKPKVLLIIDKPNWAYDQIANMIVDELGSKYDFYKCIAHYHKKNEIRTFKYKITHPGRMIKAFFYENFSYKIQYDLIVYMWWYIPEIIDVSKFKGKKILKGIYTESFPPGKTVDFEGDINSFIDKYIKPSDGIIAGSKNIYDFYRGKGLPVHYATGATDTKLFSYNRSKKEKKELVVSWTGNPNRNFKGFYDYVEPAVKLAQNIYPDIKLVTRFKGPINTLPDFYRDVDIMINASIGDAGPGFLIDAGSCGVPSISTDVGFASELIKDHENGLIVNRNIEDIAAKIIEVYEDRNLLNRMSENISSDVNQKFSHHARAKYWNEMFEKVIG